MESIDLTREFLVLSPEKNVTSVLNTPDVYQKLDKNFNQFKDHDLVACHEFSSDWPTWERHPKGDEVVVLLYGEVTFVLDIDGTHQSIALQHSGECVVVPKGVWHTAHVHKPSKVLFVTPGEATENRDI